MSNAPAPSAEPPRRKPAGRKLPPVSRRVREMIDPRLQAEKQLQELRAYLPGVLTSVGIHLVVAIVLMFVVLRATERRPPSMDVISRFMEAGDIPREPEDQPIEIPALDIPRDDRPRNDEPASSEPVPEAVAVLSPGNVGVGGALGGRRGSGRGELARKSGGTDASEKAVVAGLDWLKRNQEKEGHWSLSEARYPDSGLRSLRTDTGGTALALLAFLGAGHTHKEGLYQKEVGKGLDWLKQHQQSNGNLYDSEEEGHQQSFYAHGQATIALCEAYALTQDESLKSAAERAIGYICESQHPVKGGWKYRPNSVGDLSVFGWQIMALQSARMAGLNVPEDNLNRAAGFLDLVQLDEGARYRYEAETEYSATPAMTAEGLLCRQYLGWPKEMPAMAHGLDYITRPAFLPEWSEGKRNVYFWYYATQALHNVQGERWNRWNAALQHALVQNQVKEGLQRGSWHPKLPKGAPDEHADKAGRLYITSLCLLSLEVYYRHLPLYR